jgi:hypothetical protein
VRKLEGKTPLGRHIYIDVSIVDLQELGWRAWTNLIWITKETDWRVV